MTKQIQIKLNFMSDTTAAKQSIKSLQTELGNLAATPISTGATKQMVAELQEGRMAAIQLRGALQKATNVDTGRLNFGKFQQQLKASNMDLNKLATSLGRMGPQGVQAFSQLANAIRTSETPIISLQGRVAALGKTLANTIRWQISAYMIQGVIQSFSSIVDYAKELNESLNNIRIVTQKSVEDMARFADEANKAAKALSTTTVAYTDAALIYYQQGLDGKAVTDRVNTTIKLANVVGKQASEVSEWMTAIWNNFDDGSVSLEHYADVLAKLGAATASSAGEIAGGLEKFAAIADTVGLSYEYAASALATITAETRQSEDVVGTSLKTIFARMENLKLGDTLEDGTDLGQYSAALAKVGVNIKDSNAELKDMDTILDEIGQKWSTLSKDEQIALSQSVAGIRQYNQFMALMSNWDVMERNVVLARSATGELEKQQKVYEEGISGALNRVNAALETIKRNLLNENDLVPLLNVAEGFLTVVGDLIEALGGLPSILLIVTSGLLKMYGPQVAAGLKNLTGSFAILGKTLTGTMAEEQSTAVTQASSMAARMATASGMGNESSAALSNVMEERAKNQEMLNAKAETLTQEQKEQLFQLQQIVEAEQERYQLAAKQTDAAREATANGIDQLNNFKDPNMQGKGNTWGFRLENAGRLAGGKIDDFANSEDISAQGATGIMRAANMEFGADAPELQALKGTYQELTQNIKDYQDNQTEINNLKVKGTKITKEESATLAKLETKQSTLNSAIKQGKKQFGDQAKALQIDKKALDNFKKATENCTETQKDYYATVADGVVDNAKKAQKAESATEEARRSSQESAEQYRQTLLGMSNQQQDWATSMVNGVQNMAQFASGLMMVTSGVSSLTSAIKSGEASFSDYLSAAVSILFGLSSILTVVSKVKKGLVNLNIVKASSIGLTKKQAKAEATLGAVEEAVQTMENKNANQDMINAAKEEGADKKRNASKLKTIFMNIGEFISKGPVGWIIAAASAAMLAALIGVAIAVNSSSSQGATASDDSTKAAEASEQAAQKLTQSYQETKEAYDDLMESISSYKEAESNIATLTQGTDEWRMALMKVNDEVIKLLNQYDDLSQYVTQENGVLTISQEGLDYVTKQMEDRTNDAFAAALMGNTQAKQDRLRVEEEKLLNSIGGGSLSRDLKEGLGNAFIGTALGPLIGPLLSGTGGALAGLAPGIMATPTALPASNIAKAKMGAGSALGGMAMGTLGAVATFNPQLALGIAGVATAIDMVDTLASNQAHDAAFDILENNPDALVSFESFEKAMKDQGVANNDLIQAMYDNRDTMRENMQQAKTLEIERKRNVEMSVAQIVQSNSLLSSKLGEQEAYVDIGATQYDKLQQQYYDDYMARLTRNQNDDELLVEYAEKMGLTDLNGFDYEEMKLDKHGRIEYSYIGEDGSKETKTLSAQEIATVLSTSKAGDKVEDTLTEYAYRFADKTTEEIATYARLKSGDASELTGKDINNAQDIEQYLIRMGLGKQDLFKDNEVSDKTYIDYLKSEFDIDLSSFENNIQEAAALFDNNKRDLANIIGDNDRYLYSELDTVFNNMTISEAQNFNQNMKGFVDRFGTEMGQSFVHLTTTAGAALGDDVASVFYDKLGEMGDITSSEAWDDLYDSMLKSCDLTKEQADALGLYVDSAKLATLATKDLSLEEFTTDLYSLEKALQKAREGTRNFSKEEYDSLVKAGVSEEGFARGLSGEYYYVGDTSDLENELIDRQQEIIDDADKNYENLKKRAEISHQRRIEAEEKLAENDKLEVETSQEFIDLWEAAKDFLNRAKEFFNKWWAEKLQKIKVNALKVYNGVVKLYNGIIGFIEQIYKWLVESAKKLGLDFLIKDVQFVKAKSSDQIAREAELKRRQEQEEEDQSKLDEQTDEKAKSIEALGSSTNVSINWFVEGKKEQLSYLSQLQQEREDLISQGKNTDSVDREIERTNKLIAAYDKAGKLRKQLADEAVTDNAKVVDSLSDELDVYQDINEKLEDISHNLSSISEKKQRAFGADKIKYMREERQEMQKDIDTQKEYLKTIDTELESSYDKIKNYGFTFDGETGRITNYTEVYKQMLQRYQNGLNSTTEGSTARQAVEDAWKNFINNSKNYATTLDLKETEEAKLENKEYDYIDSKYEELEYQVELKFMVEDAGLTNIDFLLQEIEDDAYKAAESISLLGKQANIYDTKFKVNEQGIGDLLTYKGASSDDIKAFMSGDVSGLLDLDLNEQDFEMLQGYLDGMIDSYDKLKESFDSIFESMDNVFEEINEEFDDLDATLEHTQSILESYQNIIELAGASTLGISNSMQMSIMDSQVDISQTQIKNAKTQYDKNVEMLNEAKIGLANATTEKEKKKWEESIELYEEQVRQSEQDWLSALSNGLEMSAQRREKAVDIAIEEFLEATTGYKSMDELQQIYDQQKELRDLYVADYEKAYSLSKLSRELEKSINDTDSIRAKQQLLALEERINQAKQNGVKLSSYELQNLEREYQIELAKIALEEAQSAKSQVRLQRTSEGGLSYVYTADEDALREAEQKYEDAVYASQKANEEWLNSAQDSMLQVTATYVEQMKVINTATYDSEEERANAIARLNEWYLGQQEFYSNQIDTTLANNSNLYESHIATMSNYYNENGSNFYTMTNELIGNSDRFVTHLKDTVLVGISNGLLGESNSLSAYYQSLVTKVGNQKQKDSLLGKLHAAQKAYKTDTEKCFGNAGIEIGKFQDHVNDYLGNGTSDRPGVKQVLDDVTKSIKKLKNNSDFTEARKNATKYGSKVAEAMEKAAEKIGKVSSALQDLIEKWSKKMTTLPDINKVINIKTKYINEHFNVTDQGGDGTGDSEEKAMIDTYIGETVWNETDMNNPVRSKVLQIDDANKKVLVYDESKGQNYKRWVSIDNLSHLDRIPLQLRSYTSLDTGGYTGEWGPEGRWAMLHQKEIVLNAHDTENLLFAVDMVRQLVTKLDFNALSMANGLNGLIATTMLHTGGQQLEQNVTITAEFPNARDKEEIQAAFGDIINLAAQYASRR